MATMVQTVGMERHEVAATAAVEVAASRAKNILLFFAAPFIGLAYIVAFPFIGVAALIKAAVR